MKLLSVGLNKIEEPHKIDLPFSNSLSRVVVDHVFLAQLNEMLSLREFTADISFFNSSVK